MCNVDRSMRMELVCDIEEYMRGYRAGRYTSRWLLVALGGRRDDNARSSANFSCHTACAYEQVDAAKLSRVPA
jgi:hypothetical protein